MPFLGVTLSIRESWLPVMSKRSFLMAFDRVNFFISAIVLWHLIMLSILITLGGVYTRFAETTA